MNRLSLAAIVAPMVAAIQDAPAPQTTMPIDYSPLREILNRPNLDLRPRGDMRFFWSQIARHAGHRRGRGHSTGTKRPGGRG